MEYSFGSIPYNDFLDLEPQNFPKVLFPERKEIQS